MGGVGEIVLTTQALGAKQLTRESGLPHLKEQDTVWFLAAPLSLVQSTEYYCSTEFEGLSDADKKKSAQFLSNFVIR